MTGDETMRALYGSWPVWAFCKHCKRYDKGVCTLLGGKINPYGQACRKYADSGKRG